MTIVAATGRGVPSGADTQVQYNDAGVFGADANLTWNKTTKLHTISGQEIISYNNSYISSTAHYDHLRLDNTGTNTMIGFWFSGTNKSRIRVTNNATMDIAVGGSSSAFSFKSGSAMTSLLTERLYVYSEGLHTSFNGYFGKNVTMGSADTSAASALSNYGASAHKGLFVSDAAYTLANETFIYADPSAAASCVGTAVECSTYGDESTCSSHAAIGCSWNEGNDCNIHYGDQSNCESSECTWESADCAGYDEYECESQNEAYGGDCYWSTSNSCSDFSDSESCNNQSGCYWEETPCSTWDGDQSNCESNGCTWENASCSSATDEYSCNDLDDYYGGSCSWEEGGDCYEFGDQSSCEGQSGCTWTSTNCSDYSYTDQETCEGSGCGWASYSCVGPTDETDCTQQNEAYGGDCYWSTDNPCDSYGDETECSAQSGCSWNGSSCEGTFDYCEGSYYDGNCEGGGSEVCVGTYGTCTGDYYSGACTGEGGGSYCSGEYSYCSGSYYTGGCTGIFGTGCEGTANCNILTNSEDCATESGCTWGAVQVLTLPQSTTVNRNQTSREYSIVYVGTIGTVSIVPYSGDTIFQHNSDIKLYKAGDRVWLHQHHLYSDCATFSTEEDCNNNSGCYWNAPCSSYSDETQCNEQYESGCSWDSESSTCIGAESCEGTYVSSRPWFVHNLERGKNYIEKAANYTLTALDDTINCTANSFTITLPSAVILFSKTYIVKNTGAGTITINTTSSQTVDGGASGTVTILAGKSKHFTSNSANWIITAAF